MASKDNKKLSKKERKNLNKSIAEKERKARLTRRKEEALQNNRVYREGTYYDEDFDYSGAGGNPYSGHLDGTVDREFITDVQNMKFCRKPIGFFMWLFFLIIIVLLVAQFLDFQKLNLGSVGTYVTQYGSFFVEKPPVENTNSGTEEGNTENSGEEQSSGEEQTAENAAISSKTNSVLTADETEGDSSESSEGQQTSEEGTGEAAAEETTDPNVYYTIGDSVFGWLKFVVNKMNINNFSLDDKLPASPWYDAQISKIENGMTDNIAKYAILAYPAAIILYAIIALAMFIKTFICFASGDRRIYRHTWIDCFLMLIMSLIVLLGGFASTVDIDGKLQFSGIVDFLIGNFTGKGGLILNYGGLAFVALPLLCLILSFFLLEKKLRSRDIATPVILYQYKK